ncbi:DUF1266 domain-containing protein [Streptomyces aidingensis]|uniref:DUF1266 domain-containing protein n=1 Tax=Streptomyces aidingensis TaxID=910347 RepID=A0A1I1MH09_9ACTN|nr:DUF1266 domain-containing protein [Streptomyces aidingensis]SFC84092.1 Protein of unknown function [Streptomyces aidingensis]
MGTGQSGQPGGRPEDTDRPGRTGLDHRGGGDGSPAEAADWEPPTETERLLYRAASTGDWDTFYERLGNTHLFFPQRQELSDVLGGARLPAFRSEQPPGLSVPVFTRGMMPPPTPGQVYEMTTLYHLARHWLRSADWLAVNPGTPLETFVPSRPRRWKRHAQRCDRLDQPRLMTLRTGRLRDTVAHGMACGALPMVDSHELWNDPGWHSRGYTYQRDELRHLWGITSRDTWLPRLAALVHAEHHDPLWEFVLQVRTAFRDAYHLLPDAGQWQQTTEQVMLGRTAEIVDATNRPPDFDLDTAIARTNALIERILRCEARFRADGVLGPDPGDIVRSVTAWDFGVGSGMARWGVGARFGEVAEAEEALRRISEGARSVYRSWADFAAGYLLGRCLHAGDEEFGTWYTELAAVHRLLRADPESPWLTVPWSDLPGDGAAAS